MMGHWIIVPVVLPAVMGAFTVLVLRNNLGLSRVFSTAATVMLLAVALALLVGAAYFNQKEVYAWPDGYGLPDWRLDNRVLP